MKIIYNEHNIIRLSQKYVASTTINALTYLNDIEFASHALCAILFFYFEFNIARVKIYLEKNKYWKLSV